MIIQAPASKSYLQRALAIALLTKGKTVLHNVSWCNDSIAVKDLIVELGAEIIERNQDIIIQSVDLNEMGNFFSAKESGLALRMFTPILALSGKEIQFFAEGTLKSRPVGFLEKPLEQLGVSVTSNNGFPPLIIKQKLKAGEITIDGSISSQLLTGLLIALPLANGDSRITVENLKSIPYIDMTLEVVRHFGVQITQDNYRKFFIRGNQAYQPVEYTIEGDWSGASFFLVAGAITGEITVTNLSEKSLQADKKITDALEKTGAEVLFNTGSVTVRKKKLVAFTFDATHCPDLFPPLAVLAANCEGISIIKGVSRLIHKESNRGKILKNEFSKLGIKVEINDDIMKITGGKIQGGTIESHNDHRIAMMGGIFNLINRNVTIINKKTVDKSYPDFFVNLNRVLK